MKKQQNPHDKAFKNLMRQLPFAKAFIEQYFSKNELSILNLSTFELWNASFVHKKNNVHNNKTSNKDTVDNGESQSDVVYRVKTVDGKECYVVLLFEHQSNPEVLMSFRLLEYSVLLMRQHLDQGNAKLPIIMPVVFYHGRASPYPYSTDIFDCFEAPELAKEYHLKPFKLVDVTIIPDAELKKNIITAPLQIIMKHIRDNDLLPVFKELARSGILAENAQIGNGKLFLDVIHYAISTGEISSKDEFEALLLNQPDEVRRNFMTILEQHRKEVQQGMQQGMQQEKYIIAKRLLMKGMTEDLIAETTGLDAIEIKKLK